MVGAAHEAADERRFEILPPTSTTSWPVRSTIWRAWSAVSAPDRLIVGRTKETMNSLGRRLPGLARHRYNPVLPAHRGPGCSRSSSRETSSSRDPTTASSAPSSNPTTPCARAWSR
ncbi:MAG: hypothetical protein U5R31_17730 [Acidimicrobiia bacterium]|nr:hypothetical protein [Acidimicrobiia bacterium]